jgi:hypothetical protein
LGALVTVSLQRALSDSGIRRDSIAARQEAPLPKGDDGGSNQPTIGPAQAPTADASSDSDPESAEERLSSQPPTILLPPMQGAAPPQGILPAMSSAPVNPVVITQPAETPPGKEARYLEVALYVPQTDVEDKVVAAIVSAGEIGGHGNRFEEVKGPSTPARFGAILFVPEDKLGDMTKRLEAMGVCATRDDWRGALSERKARIERPLRELIADLDRERRALLSRYLEDAPPVSDVTERLAAAQGALENMKRAKADEAVLRVYVSHRP